MKNLKLWVLLLINFLILTAMVRWVPEGDGRLITAGVLVIVDVLLCLWVRKLN